MDYFFEVTLKVYKNIPQLKDDIIPGISNIELQLYQHIKWVDVCVPARGSH